MRYHELIETRRMPLTTAASPIRTAADLYPSSIPLIIRLMPCVYRELTLKIRHGGPDADISIDSARVRFNAPYDDEGRLSPSCRNWIIMMVRDAALALGLSMCLVFAEDDVVYLEENGDLVTGAKAPKGGLRL